MGDVKKGVANHPVETTVYGAGAFVILANMVGWNLTPEQASAILFAAPLVTAWGKRVWPYIIKAIRQVREALR